MNTQEENAHIKHLLQNKLYNVGTFIYNKTLFLKFKYSYSKHCNYNNLGTAGWVYKKFYI